MTNPTTRLCPSCGAGASGNFCSTCGATLGARTCAHCQAELSPQARFCHRCGRPAGDQASSARAVSERRVWLGAGALCLLLVGGIAYRVSSAAPAAAPNMANAGSSTGAVSNEGGSGGGPAPDISSMTPRERFDRLFNRIMQAAERRDSAEVERFTPMALGAYSQLDVVDVDARYHAAVLQLQLQNAPAAAALADTILAESPGHLFAYVIRGEVGDLTKNPGLRARAEGDFLAHYDAEQRAKRVEYLDHAPVLEQFKSEADNRKR
jgi:hypothetical protein